MEESKNTFTATVRHPGTGELVETLPVDVPVPAQEKEISIIPDSNILKEDISNAKINK